MGLVQTILRGLEFLWTLIVMSIVGNMIDEANGHDPSIINYSIFCAVFAMLSLFYLIPSSIKDSFTIHPSLPLALDVLNTLFWFCAGTALAAELGVHSCNANNHRWLAHNKITNGSSDMSARCSEAKAVIVFEFFAFACFAVSAFLSAFGGSGGGSVRSGIRRGPAMSQV